MFIRDKISERIHSWNHRHLSFGGRLTLIKSILGAIPIHIFQVLEPTKGALKQIEQVLARYLWGSCNASNKTHWIKWKKVCLPTHEGGLGIRRLMDTVEAFSIKMWWRFREQGSLWAQYMLQKYCSIAFPQAMSRSNRYSPTWRRMYKARNKSQGYIRWMLGEGNISFWYDIWLGEVPLADHCPPGATPRFQTVQEFWIADQWNEEAIRRLNGEWGIPNEILAEILETPFDRNEKDRGRWSLTPHGNFSVASAWELVRSREERREVHEIIWGKCIGPTISVFLWRLLANRIPVDAKLQWRGISLASRCRCCSKPDIETRLHLFVTGEAANKLWNHFARWFPQTPFFAGTGENIDLRLRWWQRHMGNHIRHHICILIPCLILWFIWTERNDCVHREKEFKVEHVAKRIIVYLRNLVLAGQIGPEQWQGCTPKVDFMKAQPSNTGSRRVETIHWRPPDVPWIKINTDGAFQSSTSHAGGGGIVRNHNGDVLAAYISPLRATSGFEAELMAIMKGISLAKQHGEHIWIESDAAIAVNMIDSGQLGPADSRHIMAQIRHLLKGISWKISYIPREGNKAADHLASLGKECATYTHFTPESTPAHVKALSRLDQLGLPNFRF